MPDYFKDGTEATFANLTDDLVFKGWVLFFDLTSVPDNILELREGA